MNKTMPKIDLDRVDIDSSERLLAEGIIASQGKNKGRLRASCPDKDLLGGTTAYIWRMVAFYISPHSRHQSMPVMAEYYVEEGNIDHLDTIVDRIIETVPKSQWYGVRRWAGFV